MVPFPASWTIPSAGSGRRNGERQEPSEGHNWNYGIRAKKIAKKQNKQGHTG